MLNVARNYKIIWKILRHSNLERHRDILVELDKRSIKQSSIHLVEEQRNTCDSKKMHHNICTLVTAKKTIRFPKVNYYQNNISVKWKQRDADIIEFDCH